MKFGLCKLFILITITAFLLGYPCIIYSNHERLCGKRQSLMDWCWKHGFVVSECSSEEESTLLIILDQWFGFSDCKVVTELVITDPSFSDLTQVGNLEELRALNLWKTAVVDLQPISRLSNLEVINLNETPVEDIAALTSIPSLKVVSLVGTNVSDFSPLISLPCLEMVYVSERTRKQVLLSFRSGNPAIYFLPAADKSEADHIIRTKSLGTAHEQVHFSSEIDPPSE